jgi:hypothetical protein
MSMIVQPDVRTAVAGVTLASGVQAVVLGPFDLLRVPRKSFTLLNVGPQTLSGAVLQINPDQGGSEAGTTSSTPGVALPAPNPALWESTATTWTSLAPGVVSTQSLAGSGAVCARWWRVVAISNQSAAITVSGWMYGTTV